MLKKLTLLLLAVCMLFCLSACGTIETNSNPIDTSSVSESDESSSTYENITSQPENSQGSSDTVKSEENDTDQTQSTTNQSTSIDTTSHLAHQSTSANTTSQPAHTHKYANATCTTPKKCSCGATQGSALGHKYQNDGVCSVCNAVDEGKYVEAQVNAADKVFADYTKYNDALKIIKTALQKFPNNATLKSKKDYYQSFAPMYLSDVEPYSKTTWFESLDEDTDIFNTKHYHCVRIAKNFTSADGTYDLSAKYNTFTATIYGLGDGTSGSLKVYADGVCVYSNTSIDPNTRPIKITLDVTGVMDLKFEMKQYYNSYLGECFGMSNVYVQKTVK